MIDYRKYFAGKEQLCKELELLHEKKYRVKELLTNRNMPSFVVEFSGLPRTGKSSSVDKIYEFFKQANIDVVKTTEPAQIIKDTMTKEERLKLSNIEFNDMTLEISRRELEQNLEKHPTIILQDRGVIDNYFWYQMMYNRGDIDRETYKQILNGLYDDLKLIDELYIMEADPEIIIMRDYINQIYLEDRKKTTYEGVSELKIAIFNFIKYLPNEYVRKVFRLDTSCINEVMTSIILASRMLDKIEDRLVRTK